MIATSTQQLLGFNVSSSASSESNEPEWVVTYFASTLFRPAELDIMFIRAIEMVGEVGLLVKDGGMFRVPH
ncbi:hypothetical protein B0H19DRAFT_1127974, partial [Mycena capillaripes]